MTNALEGLKGVKVIVDDMLIFGKGHDKKSAIEDHNKNLLSLLHRLREKNIKVNPDKIKFQQESVAYMGHILTKEGLQVDKTKTDSIDKIEIPKNID